MKSSLESCASKARVQQIDEEILRRIQINDDRKKKLLMLHKDSQSTVPLVQRVNQRVFVVRCDISLNCPIGLLHVICNAESKDVR